MRSFAALPWRAMLFAALCAVGCSVDAPVVHILPHPDGGGTPIPGDSPNQEAPGGLSPVIDLPFGAGGAASAAGGASPGGSGGGSAGSGGSPAGGASLCSSDGGGGTAGEGGAGDGGWGSVLPCADVNAVGGGP